MLARSQILTLLVVSLALWISATLYIRLLPGALLDPVTGSLSFLTTILVAWLSIVIIRRSARLSPDQLLAGVGVVGAVAMMIDGAVLHWWPIVYAADERVLRLGAAWLLWGYGVSLAIALLMARSGRQAA